MIVVLIICQIQNTLMNKASNTHKMSSLKLLIIISLFSVINSILIQNLISEEIIYNSFSGKSSLEMIKKALAFNHRFGWINYILPPLILFVNFLFVACCLWIRGLLIGLKNKFHEFWRISIISGIVFIFFSYLKTGILYYLNYQTIGEINSFQPLSLYNLLRDVNTPVYLQYALTVLNVPELLYIVAISLSLKKTTNIPFISGLMFVLKSYGTGLIIWLTLVTFFLISIKT